MTFIYGECDGQPNPEEGFGCVSPLQMIIRAISISADSEARALRAAEALRTVDADTATDGDLPAPTLDADAPLERCSAA